MQEELECYKTASGNHCCNPNTRNFMLRSKHVTKPQAVITVATLVNEVIAAVSKKLQNRKR